MIEGASYVPEVPLQATGDECRAAALRLQASSMVRRVSAAWPPLVTRRRAVPQGTLAVGLDRTHAVGHPLQERNAKSQRV